MEILVIVGKQPPNALRFTRLRVGKRSDNLR
jgi:hypothetical protein